MKKKKMKKAVRSVAGAIGACSVVAGALDWKEQKEREREAEKGNGRMHHPYGIYEKRFKRPLDFFLSSIALIALSPVMLVTAFLVHVKLGSPVLFVQKRHGRDERLFDLYKFRSMSDERDENGDLLPDSLRVGGFGSVLRRLSLDELPELVNILKGDMSIVGPRPLLVKYLPYFTAAERARHDVRPGLTGMAQSSGRNVLTWDERFAYDIGYVKKITFMGDMKIVLRTVKKVLKEEDIVVSGTEGSIPDLDVERKMKTEEAL